MFEGRLLLKFERYEIYYKYQMMLKLVFYLFNIYISFM